MELPAFDGGLDILDELEATVPGLLEAVGEPLVEEGLENNADVAVVVTLIGGAVIEEFEAVIDDAE